MLNLPPRPSEHPETTAADHLTPAGARWPVGPRISVIIPVLNGGADFLRCLASLTAVSPAPDEVIVVIDGGSDGSAQAAGEFGARVVELPSTGGPARARNVGARAAKGELLVFLDADVAIHADAFGQMVAAFGKDPALAALFGSYDDAPAAPNFLSQYRNLLHHFVHQDSREDASTFWSGCGAIRRDVFLQMGGFDENYRQPSIEDIELGYRMTRSGHRIRLCKTVLATHLKHWRVASLLKADVALRAVPWTELILRDGRFLNDLNLRHSSRASVILAYGVLGCLAAAWWWPGLLVPAVVGLLAIVALNARLFAFFGRKRGVAFALASLPWFFLFQIYSGLGFGIGLVRHWTRR